jgi:hypothetical protein
MMDIREVPWDLGVGGWWPVGGSGGQGGGLQRLAGSQRDGGFYS